MVPQRQNPSRICCAAANLPLHPVALPPPQLVNVDYGSSLSTEAKNHYQDKKADEARQDNSLAPANQLSPDLLALACPGTRKAEPDPSLLFRREKVPRTLGKSAALHVEGGMLHLFSLPSNALSANTAVLAKSPPKATLSRLPIFNPPASPNHPSSPTGEEPIPGGSKTVSHYCFQEETLAFMAVELK